MEYSQKFMFHRELHAGKCSYLNVASSLSNIFSNRRRHWNNWHMEISLREVLWSSDETLLRAGGGGALQAKAVIRAAKAAMGGGVSLRGGGGVKSPPLNREVQGPSPGNF